MNDIQRAYSPGLKGVLAGETALAMVDGTNGRLLYRGYPISELVARGSYAHVAELLWTGEWPARAHLPCAPLPDGVIDVLRRLPADANAMDALRTAVSAGGAIAGAAWPP
ncbi:MAG: citrate/2-methylcitrate synthase, partial [Candidatus Limnocylindria bacterium]